MGTMTPLMHLTLPEPGENSIEAHFAPLVFLLEGPIRVNMWHMQRELKRAAIGTGEPIPPLYSSGVRYAEDEDGREDWRDCLEILRRGKADCDGLVCYRTAELRVAGFQADPVIKWQHLTFDQARSLGYPEFDASGNCVISREHGLWLVHCCVRVNGGTPMERIEDPSKELGMGAEYSNRA